MLEKSWEFLSKICTPKGDYGRWVKFWFSICRHVCAAVLLVVVAWPTPVNAVLIYAEPPDLGSPLIPTLLGPLGQGNNVISGVVREGPQDGQGDAHDAFRILVPVDKTITSVSFIATGRADHTSGNVSILDSASSVPTTNFNFNNAIVYSPSVPPLTGPRSLEFRTFEVGSSVKVLTPISGRLLPLILRAWDCLSHKNADPKIRYSFTRALVDLITGW